MSLFPRGFTSEFAPMFRLLDDYASHASATRGSEGFAGTSTGLAMFQPRFDVKETLESYEVTAELPGVKRENLSIEFTDNYTLRIKGHTEHHRKEEDTRPDFMIEGESAGAIEDAPKNTSQYHKASVEDENAMSGANPEAAHHETAHPEAAETKQVAKHGKGHKKHEKPSVTRWVVSERSVGTFCRSFQFPTRVDQDNVKASLQDGILSIIVPKISAHQAKKITVE